jgi:hypothetical protein
VANSNNYNNTQTNCSAPSLLGIIRNVFSKIPDHRTGTTTFTLADALMSGLAVFGLKYASLLNFDEDQDDPIIRHNLKTLYGVGLAPCDSQLREICDPVNPIAINPAFNRLHQSIRDQGLLKRYEYLDGFVLISLDGTGQFSSNKLGCPQCCEKHHRNGTTEHYHQLLGAVVIHPDLPQVLPFMPEAILKGDGDSKNDCESNASKRLLPRLKKDHPELRVIAVEDALSANGPHIGLFKSLSYSFIIGAKPAGNAYLFKQLDAGKKAGATREVEVTDKQGVLRGYRFANGLGLNATYPGMLVNMVEYWEAKGGKVQNFSWITDIEITTGNVDKIVRGGRARWKIENETFNTLKNQGYHLEHNYGHGAENLATVFGVLTFLAFLVDQIQALGCPLFKEAQNSRRTKISFWGCIRALVTANLIASWEALWNRIINAKKVILDTG